MIEHDETIPFSQLQEAEALLIRVQRLKPASSWCRCGRQHSQDIERLWKDLQAVQREIHHYLEKSMSCTLPERKSGV